MTPAVGEQVAHTVYNPCSCRSEEDYEGRACPALEYLDNNPEDPTMKNNKCDQVFIGIEVDEKDCESKDDN